MIRQHQLYRHEPHNGIYGDCHRTVIACLLDLPVHAVPHFGQLAATTPDYNWVAAVKAFLATRGLDQVDMFWDADYFSLEYVLAAMRSRNPHAYGILGGRSPRGTDHSVIIRGGEIVWDPHPAGGGVVGPLSHGQWEVTYLIPLAMTAEAA